jgi:hypothetical protein
MDEFLGQSLHDLISSYNTPFQGLLVFSSLSKVIDSWQPASPIQWFAPYRLYDLVVDVCFTWFALIGACQHRLSERYEARMGGREND